jgi:phage gpG-like protein
VADAVEIDGLTRLRMTLASAAGDVAEPKAALEASGRLLEARGRGLAPVATGALAGSLRASSAASEVSVSSALPYAAVTEYGGGNNIPAQPFLRPALANSQPLIEAAFMADMEKALSKVKGI